MLNMKPHEDKAFAATPQPSPCLNVTLFINTYLHFPWENVPLLPYGDLRDVCVAGLFILQALLVYLSNLLISA